MLNFVVDSGPTVYDKVWFRMNILAFILTFIVGDCLAVTTHVSYQGGQQGPSSR